MKWYWWVFIALAILYLIGKQKNLTIQQELCCVFSSGFCGSLTSGDTFNGTISTINPGITEGNLGHACAPIGVPTCVHCNLCPTPVRTNPTMPPRIINRPMVPVAPHTMTPSLPTFHSPAALVPAASTGLAPCMVTAAKSAASTPSGSPALPRSYYCGFVGQIRTFSK